MWICSRCQTANKDGYTQCVECSAPRNARRFGAGTPVSAPSVQTVPPERRMQPPAEREAPPPPRRQPSSGADSPPSPPPRAPGGFVRLAGILLSVLLPLCAALFFLIRKDALQPFVNSLFFKPGDAIPPVFDILAYVLSALVAVLLALLPGLSLWSLGRMVRAFRGR